MKRRRCWVGLAVIAALLLVGGAVVVVPRLRAPNPPEWAIDPPDDNALDEYLQVASVLQAKPNDAQALVLLHQAADKECVVVSLVPPGPDPRLRPIIDLASAIAFVVQDRAAQGQPDEALGVAVDGVAMAVGLEHGDLVWSIIACSSEDTVGMALDEAADSASSTALRQGAQRLGALDGAAPTFGEVRRADQYWAEMAVGPLSARDRWTQYRIMRKLYPVTERKFLRAQGRRRALMTKLAVLAYRHERGTLPADLAALVPDYLDSVPEDPFTGQALKYRRSPGGFVVYSVGEDEKDDGGVAMSWRGRKKFPGDVRAGFPAAQYHPW